MTLPWTLEELQSLQSELDASIERTEQERPNVRPLPPLAEGEAKDLLLILIETATERPLDQDEAFLCGQLLAAFRQAVEARMLGKHGRYYTISAEDIEREIRKMVP